MNDPDLTADAADLAERIVDEVSRAEQDWAKIAAWARRLAELAEEVAAERDRE
ncbi:MAG: hypothetical protein IRZ21_11050 [Thermoleophilaceae bacterium]|nr:hypothetical protein [Thermoleophilaceae bacterium]